VPTAARGPASIQLPGCRGLDDDRDRGAAVRREFLDRRELSGGRDELTTALMVVPARRRPRDRPDLVATSTPSAASILGLCLVAVEQVPDLERVMPPSLFEMARQISSATRFTETSREDEGR